MPPFTLKKLNLDYRRVQKNKKFNDSPTFAVRNPEVHKSLFETRKDIVLRNPRYDRSGHRIYNTLVVNTIAVKEILANNLTPEQVRQCLILLDKGLDQQKAASSFSGKLESKSSHCQTDVDMGDAEPRPHRNPEPR